jgi:hypothetical protein
LIKILEILVQKKSLTFLTKSRSRKKEFFAEIDQTLMVRWVLGRNSIISIGN